MKPLNFFNTFKKKPKYQIIRPKVPNLVLTHACLEGIMKCVIPEMKIGHEGVCYVLGLTTEDSTLAVTAFRPESETTSGSFDVGKMAMAKIVRCAANLGLQVVGQAHTHPGEAYHSKGDDEGASIAYRGYCSLVFPYYGQYLPSLKESAAFIYNPDGGFVEIETEAIKLVKGVSR